MKDVQMATKTPTKIGEAIAMRCEARLRCIVINTVYSSNFVIDPRASLDKLIIVCWTGVYLGNRGRMRIDFMLYTYCSMCSRSDWDVDTLSCELILLSIHCNVCSIASQSLCCPSPFTHTLHKSYRGVYPMPTKVLYVTIFMALDAFFSTNKVENAFENTAIIGNNNWNKLNNMQIDQLVLVRLFTRCIQMRNIH